MNLSRFSRFSTEKPSSQETLQSQALWDGFLGTFPGTELKACTPGPPLSPGLQGGLITWLKVSHWCIKALAERESSGGSTGEDPFPRPCGCWQGSFPCRLLARCCPQFLAMWASPTCQLPSSKQTAEKATGSLLVRWKPSSFVAQSQDDIP